ncbi:hypothetical protein ACSBR1_031538 [Camellia fascicularis]
MAATRTLHGSFCFASSSSLTQPRWSYDVFLSFRGEDTCKNFTDHLYAESRISVVVFLTNYASSRWCLDKLVKIIEFKKTLGQLVLPQFYDVDPSDIRHQTWCFGEAFGRHEKRYVDEMEKVKVRKAALSEAANLSGWDLENVANGYEAKFIRKIIKDVLCELKHTFLDVAVHPIGIDSRVEHINLMLCIGSDDVCMIGLYGLGGIGKTTIAKVVYNPIFLQFKGSCFLANVREVVGKLNGLVQLQEQLLFELFGTKNLKIGSVDRGINLIKERLHSKKVLIVLDDVDQSSQLNTLRNQSVFTENVKCNKAFVGMHKLFVGMLRLCLLRISERNELLMHDLLKDMGREILREKYPKEPEKRSTLWLHEDVCYVLEKNKGTKAVEGVILTLPMLKKIQWSNKAFVGMHKLRLLQINHVHLSGNFEDLFEELRWLCWHNCPLENLPSNFHQEKLVILDMQFNRFKTLRINGKQFKSLKILNLSNSKCLTKSPIFCALPMLEELLLESCTGLMELHESIGLLDKLVHLNLKYCMNLRYLPGSICELKAVKHLNLTGCAKLEEFPENLGHMECLTELLGDGTTIKQLPFSIGLLNNLRRLSLKGCNRQLTTESWFFSHFILGFT